MPFDGFVKIAGVPGEASDEDFKGQIEIVSFAWGVSQPVSAGYGGGDGTSICKISDFSFIHQMDKASPVLFQKCCSGEHIPKITISMRKAGGTQLVYNTYVLSDCIISSVRPGGRAQAPEEIPLEEVTISFAECSIDYQPQGADGQADGGPVHGGWNIKANAPA
jgi:type VI secretion system secreted protein Hcp